MPPAIAVSYTSRIPAGTFAEFKRLVAADGLDLQFEQRKEDGPFAALEWLIPTAAMVFISKAYFDGFLKEMGKDHYALLKAGLKLLYVKLLGPEAPNITVVSAGGKTRPDQPYSLLYSILAEACSGYRFKLLLRRSASQQEYEATIEAFLGFVEAYHEGTLDSVSVAEIAGTRVVGRTILLAYDPAAKRICVVDPLPGRSTDEA